MNGQEYCSFSCSQSITRNQLEVVQSCSKGEIQRKEDNSYSYQRCLHHLMSPAHYKRSFHGKALIANPHIPYGSGKNHTYACLLLGIHRNIDARRPSYDIACKKGIWDSAWKDCDTDYDGWRTVLFHQGKNSMLSPPYR